MQSDEYKRGYDDAFHSRQHSGSPYWDEYNRGYTVGLVERDATNESLNVTTLR